MVDIDVLEQWAAQFRLAAAGGPHDDGGVVGERPATRFSVILECKKFKILLTPIRPRSLSSLKTNEQLSSHMSHILVGH